MNPSGHLLKQSALHRPAVPCWLLLAILRGAAATAAEPTGGEPVAEPTTLSVTAAPGNGATIDAGSRFSLNIRGRIQVRYQLQAVGAASSSAVPTTHSVTLGTARLWLSGRLLSPKLTYLVQLALAPRDFRDDAKSPIYDAFFDWKLHRDFSLKIGQYFVPFDRLRTVREFALQMADRPAVVGEFTLDRDIGVTLYSDRFLSDASVVAWRIGAFGGGGIQLAERSKPGGLLVARLELRPLGPVDDDSEGDLDRRDTPGLAVGIAGALNINAPRLRGTTGALYSGGTVTYRHLAADVVFKWKGLAVEGEYLWRQATSDVVSPATKMPPEYSRSGQGWVFQGSYAFPHEVEVVARLSRLYPLTGTSPALSADLDARPFEYGVGLNYYLNGHRFKIQVDWLVRAPASMSFASASHLAHVQLDATF